MIQDEYKRLLSMLEQTTDPESVSLEEILKEAVIFFEALRKEFPAASKEEREKMIHMMTHLHARLNEISKSTAEASGMSEEQLHEFAENPSNFTPEQWQEVQETRRKLYDSARKFSSALEQEKDGQAPKAKEPMKHPGPKKSARRPRRKEWKKS